MTKTSRTPRILILSLLFLASAACVRFHPKPLVPAAVMENFETRMLEAPELRDFLLQNKEVEEWPLILGTLTLIGLLWGHQLSA